MFLMLIQNIKYIELVKLTLLTNLNILFSLPSYQLPITILNTIHTSSTDRAKCRYKQQSSAKTSAQYI